MEPQVIDHLFRHQYGKMVAILSRLFGLQHLELIEDAVQDTFTKATLQWRTNIPDNPEAWLVQAAKNRSIDLLRKLKADKDRYQEITSGSSAIHLNDLFLDHEIEDSQLRMIFVACHPSLHPNDQVAFALKTISGFSMKEIAAALLQKDESIKKRLVRARKSIIDQRIVMDYPSIEKVQGRMQNVMDVIYLTFNEGFHSSSKNELIRRDLCAEAIRLTKLLLKKEKFRSGKLYALFALMCFHSARLPAKINASNEIIDLEHQDRSKWNYQFVFVANDAMFKAMEYQEPLSTFHYEAAIAAEHIKAPSFSETNWEKVKYWYEELDDLRPTNYTKLNLALVNIQLKLFDRAWELLDGLNEESFSQRAYLVLGAYSRFFEAKGNNELALEYLNKAIDKVSNEQEKTYLLNRRGTLKN